MSRLILLVALVSLLVSAAAFAQPSNAAAPLQGRWVVTAAEHEGKPLGAIKGGIMTITGNAFEVGTAAANCSRVR